MKVAVVGVGLIGGSIGLAARQRSVEVPGSLRALHAFPARKHLPSRLAVLRQLDGRAAVRTREVSRFGSTACKSHFECLACLEPFDHFKVH